MSHKASYGEERGGCEDVNGRDDWESLNLKIDIQEVYFQVGKFLKNPLLEMPEIFDVPVGSLFCTWFGCLLEY